MSEALSVDAIREIERLVKASQPPPFVSRPGDPPHAVHQWDNAGGVYEFTEVEPPPLAVQLDTPQSLIDFSNQYGDAEASVVYYGEDKITLVLDRENRRDRATCKLLKSPQFLWLLNNKQAMNQASFVRLLRIDLQGCLLHGSELLATVRNLKWSGNSDASGNLQHAKESLGRAIEASVSGAGTIPEEVTLQVPVFENFSFLVSIRCAVEVLVHEQQFRLTPYPLALRRGMDETMKALLEELEAQPSPCFLGSV